jgi:hypothetical protein
VRLANSIAWLEELRRACCVPDWRCGSPARARRRRGHRPLSVELGAERGAQQQRTMGFPDATRSVSPAHFACFADSTWQPTHAGWSLTSPNGITSSHPSPSALPMCPVRTPLKWSGRLDSNQRPSGPEPDAHRTRQCHARVPRYPIFFAFEVVGWSADCSVELGMTRQIHPQDTASLSLIRLEQSVRDSGPPAAVRRPSRLLNRVNT